MLRNLLPLLLVLVGVSAGLLKRSAKQKRDDSGKLYSCPQLVFSTVCSGYKINGFTYSDGCQEITCSMYGFAERLKMLAGRCPTAANDEDGVEYCKKVIEKFVAKKRLFLGSGEQTSQEFTCPQLAISKVCAGSETTNLFTYSDGCNEITCQNDGTGKSILRSCPEPEDDAGKSYCKKAKDEMRAQMGRSSIRNRCLEPSEMCPKERWQGVKYHDGCSNCWCTGEGSSQCEKNVCYPVLMTEREFKDYYCKFFGAGIQSEDTESESEIESERS